MKDMPVGLTPVNRWAWVMEYHPEVYEEFERRTINLLRLGHHRFSQRMIWESMRHDSMVRTGGPAFKLNDHCTKYAALEFMNKHPRYGEVFQIRGD